MKNLTEKIRVMVPLLFAALSLGSCIKEREIDGGITLPNGDTEKSVRMWMRVPANSGLGTRALGSAQEDEVDNVTVLATKSDGFIYKHETLSGNITAEGSKRVFEISLPVGTGYNIIVIANANDLIATLYPGGIAKGTALSAVAANLVVARQEADMSKTGDRDAEKWNTAVNASRGYLIPMWGQLSGVTVEDVLTQDIGTVNLYRMVSKIDVRVPRTDKDGTDIITEANFMFQTLSFHNYNTRGSLIPIYANGDWETSGGGKASAISVPSGSNYFVSDHDKYQQFGSTLITAYTPAADDMVNPEGTETALVGEIYAFETAKGSTTTTKPCVILGGSYQGGSTTYYRVDMVKTGTTTYLDLLRNHRYIVWVKKISGPGYDTIEEAYKSAPINLEAEVIPWDESEYLEGVWNGNHFIKFSSLTSHFSQFGEPAAHTVTIRTNCDELRLSDFMNIDQVNGDGTWTTTEAAEGTWTNGRFTVVSAKTATSGDETEYTLTISAVPTDEGDTRRTSQFTIKALNLEVTATITQDSHIEFLLESNDPTTLMEIDGDHQRVEINLVSTHDFKVDFKSHPMFLGVYDAATGGNDYGEGAAIPASTRRIWVEVDQHASQTARVGELFIEHIASVNSTAGALIYKVLQITPTIDAVLSTGGREGTIAKGGGSVTINVTSNLSDWAPVLRIKRESVADEDYAGDLGVYFTPAAGAQSRSVTFTLGAITGDTDVVYEIHFKDVNDRVATSNPIEITHLATLPGEGGGGYGTGRGILAPRGILAVDGNGILNIDGPDREDNYIVYFKWGSTIAIAGSDNITDSYTYQDIAWVPKGFTSTLTSMTWSNVPYIVDNTNYADYLTDGVIDHSKASPANGIGDPCRLAAQGDVVGKYRMPKGNTYEMFLYETIQTENTKWLGANNYYSECPGMIDDANDQFYPAAGFRTNSSGQLSNVNLYGNYWSGESYGNDTHSYILHFYNTSVRPSNNNPRANGLAIRCIPE